MIIALLRFFLVLTTSGPDGNDCTGHSGAVRTRGRKATVAPTRIACAPNRHSDRRVRANIAHQDQGTVMKHSYLWVLTGLALATSRVASAQGAEQLPGPRALLTVEDAYPHVAADGRLVFQSN